MKASLSNELCGICLNTFDTPEHMPVILSCGHQFCYPCILCLETAGDRKCPTCYCVWAGVEAKVLPGMAGGTNVKYELKLNVVQRKPMGMIHCRKHERAYEFIRKKEKDFLCKKCIMELDLRTSDLLLIDEAIPLIKADFTDRVLKTDEKLKVHSEAIEDFHEDCSAKLDSLIDLKKKVINLEEKLKRLISDVEKFRHQKYCDTILTHEVIKGIEQLKSEANISLMISIQGTLDDLQQRKALPVLQDSETLLCNIARNFQVNGGNDELPISETFINELMISLSTKKSVQSLTKVVLSAEKLKANEEWNILNSNSLAARLALLDRQPRVLRLISCLGNSEPLQKETVAAVVKAAQNCKVCLELEDSFTWPERHNTDQKLLDLILANSSLCLTAFIGHLDAANIARLPTTVSSLGLAIGSAADARVVSGLKPWDGLTCLSVSVSSSVSICDLGKLRKIPFLRIYFPGLTDTLVDNVRLAIDALVPDMEYCRIVFPCCKLTAVGVACLTEQLRGARIQNITFELIGSWQPTPEDKDLAEQAVFTALGCHIVHWEMERHY